MPAKTEFVTMSDGARIRVAIDGDPRGKTVTFTHSLAASGAMWQPQVDALQSRFRLLRIDFRGHGESSVRPPPTGFDRLAQDIVTVWDHLGIERSHYVGLSLGGIVGAVLGLQHRQRLERLVLADCRFDATEAYLNLWSRRQKLLQQSGMEAIAEDTLPTWLTAKRIAADPALAATLREGIARASAEGWQGIVNLFPSLDLKGKLSQIDVLTLVLCGTEDGVFNEMKACAALLPNGRFEAVQDAGHLANLDQPASFTRSLEQFLA